MTAAGGVPVGRLDGLPQGEARAVRGLRRWCDGTRSWTAYAAELEREIGRRRATDGTRALDTCCRLLLTQPRRPLVRHSAGCICVGADEAVFARIIACAGAGEREDAMLMACLLARADLAAPICAAAEVAGMALSHGAPLPQEAAPRGLRLN
ncbi:hypothetical protein DRV85_05235 [Rhodosalinus halophilus]|uniref:Uncharacterized protein n=1 Tax=Rhodosalinus halophilus TaxID=2259333 RepID=A0A365UB58_9RHOB|nr:hypothetical protein [Rhodosalinus halophilus]RBI86161.1 hypothetical protein DRV85_05235 [Rhodosalinus halophilus]